MTIREIKTLPNGEQYIEFTDAEMQAVGWSPGDTLKWEDNGDGSYTLSRLQEKETEYVLVDCITQYRMRYCVEVPKGDFQTALDVVSCEEAKEFSQLHVGESILSHRVVTKEEALALSREDNDYTRSWTDEQHLNSFITRLEDY